MQRSKRSVGGPGFVVPGAAAVLFGLQAANLLSLNFQTSYR